jgi:dolichyl-phosphate beta-glucosyltransferase
MNPCVMSRLRTRTLLTATQLFLLLHLLAPKPRPPLPSEKTYITTSPNSIRTGPRQLPCWHDRWLAETRLDRRTEGATIPAREGFPTAVLEAGSIEPAEIEMSVVIPAYNEEERLEPALEEMVAFLNQRFGRSLPQTTQQVGPESKSQRGGRRLVFENGRAPRPVAGYEILIVNDGSTDRTVDVALAFARKHALHDILRVVTLKRNRGKGGSVTHGFRHVRGEYALFVDADGASRFSDLDKLIQGCDDVVDGSNRGVAIGSRAHLVGSEEVVKVGQTILARQPGTASH